MESSEVKSKRRLVQVGRNGIVGIFQRSLNDIRKQNQNQPCHLPLQITIAQDLESQNLNSTKPLDEQITAATEKSIPSEKATKNSKILNDKLYKDFGKQGTNLGQYSGPNDDKHNSNCRQSSDRYQEKSCKSFERPGLCSRQHSDVNDRHNSNYRQSSDLHNDKLCKNSNKRGSCSEQYSDLNYKHSSNFTKNSDFYYGKLHRQSLDFRRHSDKPFRSQGEYSSSSEYYSHHSNKNIYKHNSNSKHHHLTHNDNSHKNSNNHNSNSRHYSEYHSDNSFKNLNKHYSDDLSKKIYKDFDQHNSSSSHYSELHNNKESDKRLKNQSNKIEDDIGEKHHCDSNEVDFQGDELEDSIKFGEIKHQHSFLESDCIKVCIKDELPELEPVSNTDTNLSSNPASSNIVSNPSDLTNYNTEQILCSSKENFIPPPVCPPENVSSSPSTSSEKNEMILLPNKSLESAEVLLIPDGDEAYFSLPDSEHLEAISKFIAAIVKERSVANSIAIASRVVNDLNALFKNHFEGNVIDVYGSYETELAITTSDINIFMNTDASVRKSFMFEVYKILSSELGKYHVHPFEEGISAHKSKINFIHPDTGVNCQLAYLGKYKENIDKMAKFLKRMCYIDERVKILIIAVKIWAEELALNEVEDGKLHPLGFALLVIHFLQHCENPLLPINSYENNWNILSPNNSSVGELWLAFLRYYSIAFNWQQDVLTVNSRECVPKKSKHWETYWIAIEDPFSGKNIAETVVNSDIANYIKSCFKSSYEYFSNPPEVIPLSPSNGTDQSSGESSCSRLEFSFQHCIAEQNDAFCEECYEIDDVCEDCKKKLYVAPMASVPKMTDSFLKIVRRVLLTVHNKYVLSPEEVNERKQFVKKLQQEVQKVYPDVLLNLFGSSTNGFGFKNSDLDICLTFKSKKTVNTASILRDLRSLLRKDKNFDRVIAIFNAQIPIIKFHYQPKGWRGDISLDNTLAVYNSELLYTYSLLDERSKILGCALKLLAKKALISEVTECALSSYSYLNMAIHFLQQTDPPVLPVLQDNEFRKDNYKLDDIVESCNVWFCTDIEYIKSKFKAENDTQVEQLFLDLLDYYCSFDYKQFITIRQKEILHISEKQRSARLFNIQDPFIVTKNLGCVVSATKAQETRSVFNRARQLFRTPIKELPSGIKDLEDYFFSTMSLTGRIHKEAHCNLCGKFGHEQKECKQSYFPQRNNFTFRPFWKRNTYASRHVAFKKPLNGPYQKKTYL